MLEYCAVAYAVVNQPRLSSKQVEVIEERHYVDNIRVDSDTCGSKFSYKYQSSSKRFKHQISNRTDRQYCCFTVVEGTGKLQSIR